MRQTLVIYIYDVNYLVIGTNVRYYLGVCFLECMPSWPSYFHFSFFIRPSSLDEDGLLQAKITITEDVGELEEEEENNFHKGGNADSIKIKPLDNWECKYCHESYVKDEDRGKNLNLKN